MDPGSAASFNVMADSVTFRVRIVTTTPDGKWDWGDGTPQTTDTGSVFHTYAHGGPWLIQYYSTHNPPNVTRINITEPTAGEITDALSVNVSSMKKLLSVNSTDNPNLTSLDLSMLPVMNRITCIDNMRLSSLLVPQTTFFTTIAISGTLYPTTHSLTSIDTHGTPNLTSYVVIGPGPFSSVDISHNPDITSCNMPTNMLSSATVDSILISLAGFTKNNGNTDLSNQQPPAPPSAAGVVAIGVLLGRGWTVTTD